MSMLPQEKHVLPPVPEEIAPTVEKTPPGKPDIPIALAHADARRLINLWSQKGFFRVRGLGGKITVEDIIGRSSYKLRLQTQYEDRSVGQSSVPYRGGGVDDRGGPPDPMQIPVQRPTKFQERTEQIPIAHTERVQTCSTCGGDTRVVCTQCNGFGRVNCTWCGGSGYRTRMQTRTEHDAQGNLVTRTENVRESCTCFNGKVSCSGCGGQGRVVCGQCQGAGKLKTFDVLNVRFHCPVLSDVLHGTKVPKSLLGRATGKVLIDEQATPAVSYRGVAQDVDSRVDALLKQAHSAPDGKSRVLFQHLYVEQVNIQEVAYRYGNSPVKHLWIYDDEQQVHAPGAPRPWGKLALILGGAAAVIGLGVFFLLTMVLR